MTRKTDLLRVMGALLAAGTLAAILVLTLRPAGPIHSLGGPSLCIVCGRFGLANLLRNLLLFLPLGVGLGLALRSGASAVALPVMLAGMIEITQLFVPGRNTLLVDFLANAVGGAAGVALAVGIQARVAWPGRTGWSVTRGRRGPEGVPVAWAGALAALLAGVGILGGTAVAFQIEPPPPPHHIQWTPRLAHFHAYEGRVEEALLDGEPMRIGRHPEPAALEAGLLGGGVLVVEFIAGPPPRRLAPIFAVHTAAHNEFFVLGTRGNDLVLRLPLRAARFRLDRPELRVAGALAGIEPGDRVRASVRLTPRGACARVQDTEGCELRPTLGRGWALLLFPEALPEALRTWLDVGWLAFLAFVPALLLGTPLGAAATWGVLGAGALAFGGWTGSVAWLPAWELGALALGALTGWVAMATLCHLAAGRSGSTPVAPPQQTPPRKPGQTDTLRKSSPEPSSDRSGM